jgi:hypothetical protein
MGDGILITVREDQRQSEEITDGRFSRARDIRISALASSYTNS